MNRLLFSALLLLASLTTAAQTVINKRMDFGSAYDPAFSIPKEFSYGGTPLLILHEQEEQSLLVYDEDIRLVKTIHLGQEKTFDFQLEFKDWEREVKTVEVINEDFSLLSLSFSEWLEQVRRTDPGFTEEKMTITVGEHGDSLIFLDLENSFSDVRALYFNYNTFGKQYPKRYWRCRNGQIFQCHGTYHISYTPWRVVGTHQEQRQEPRRCINLCNINLNQGDGRATSYFTVSQTLFNEDEEFEYIIPKYVLSEEGFGGYTFTEPTEVYWDDEPIQTKRSDVISEKTKLALAGFQVVSSDGTVHSDLNFGQNLNADIAHAFVVTIGTKTYLAFSGWKADAEVTFFYLIDKKTSQVKPHSIAPASLTAHPTLADKSEPVTVELGADSHVRELSIVNAAGQVLHRIPVAENQKQVTLPAHLLSPGMNIIFAKSRSGSSACKVIVR